jgi:hypothetical protein
MTTVIDGLTGTSIAGASSTEGNFSVGGQLNLAAGTTTVAPLDFTAGTNLTTAIAGAMEYDGRVIYATPQGTQRGVVPGAQFFRLNADLVGANVNTAQSVFGVGVTLSASTVYQFEAVYAISKTAGTTSHTVGLGFGGTATVNNIAYDVNYHGDTAAFSSTNQSIASSFLQTVSNSTITGASTSATRFWVFTLTGNLSVNAGGTFIPQYTCSAAPGGAYTTVISSYFLIYPIGASGANTSVGTWA